MYYCELGVVHLLDQCQVIEMAAAAVVGCRPKDGVWKQMRNAGIEVGLDVEWRHLGMERLHLWSFLMLMV